MSEIVVRAATAALVRFNPVSRGYEVLLGQAPFDNFLKATSGVPPPPMRYPGEFRIPGGALDPGETASEAALREVEEELHVTHPQAKPRLFSVRRTAVVRGRRHLMYNYLIHSSENPWVQTITADHINTILSERKARFEGALESGTYWKLSNEEKMELAPEVVEARWWGARDACRVLASSRGEAAFGFPEPHATEMFARYGLDQGHVVEQWRAFSESRAPGETLFWNDYQYKEMSARNIPLRDPMYQTLRVMANIDQLPPPEALDLDEVCSHENILKRSNVEEW